MKKLEITSILAVLGTLIGALGGAYLGATIQKQATIEVQSRANLAELQREAYEDFLQAQAAHLVIKSFDSEDDRNEWIDWSKHMAELDETTAERLKILHLERELDIRDARLRLAIFAPADVIDELAAYDDMNKDDLVTCGNIWKQEVEIYLKMRSKLRENIEFDKVDPKKLFQVMFRCRVDSTG